MRYGLTHEEMAQMIGASRETVTRLLSDLRRKQYVKLEGSTLVMRNRPALEALVSSLPRPVRRGRQSNVGRPSP